MCSEDIDAASVIYFDPYRALRCWHILATNLTMWKESLLPTITYSSHDQLPDGRIRLDDLVEYYTRRLLIGFIPTNFQGVDTQSKYKPSRFQWRGNGLMKLFTSQFGFVFVDNEIPTDQSYQWLATMFDSTPFNSVGIDFMTRTRHIPTRVVNDFVRLCQNHPILGSHAKKHVFHARNR